MTTLGKRKKTKDVLVLASSDLAALRIAEEQSANRFYSALSATILKEGGGAPLEKETTTLRGGRNALPG